MNDKLISIITPTYNCAEFISRTIESVQAQTYQNWEMVIVDDRSKDNTKEIVEKFMKNDARIKYYLLEVNSGAAVARTTAMKLAKGSYMAFLDSDDIWMPDKLERQINWMTDNGCAFSCTAYEQIDEEDKLIGKVVKSVKKTDYNRLLLDCPVGNSTVVYDVEKIWGMPDVLMKYRIRRNSISSNKFKVIKYHWILYREIEHLSIPRSVFHIVYWCVIKVLRLK